MSKFTKPIAIVLLDITFYQERTEFFHRIVNQLRNYRYTPIPGFTTKPNSPTIEAEFDVGVFVEAILEKNEGIAQITIVCNALRITVKDLCQHLPASSRPKLLAKITGEPHP